VVCFLVDQSKKDISDSKGLRDVGMATSIGSVSVFEVGIGFSVFFLYFKSVWYSVSVFQNTAISVPVFGVFFTFALF